MFVLGLQGSPRLKGNTGFLVSVFLDRAEDLGARTLRVDVARKKISPCLECGTCEREGFCPIDDDMQEMYFLLWKADIIVLATPVFFYGFTAQLKALIDRSQALWARKYVHKIDDPGRKWRRGCLLSVGATKGKNLFDGVGLTARYFFDALGASFERSLGYRKIEGPGEIKEHPTALAEVGELAESLVSPLLERKRVLFVSRENRCRSQMASAFSQFYGGDRVEVQSAGSAPGESLNAFVNDVMREKGLDMAFRKPQAIEEACRFMEPEIVVSMESESRASLFAPAVVEHWNVPDPSGKPVYVMQQARNEIEKRAKTLVASVGI